MFQLGPFTLANPWIMAPMAGVSEMPYRVIVREMGAAAAPTELVSAKGLIYGSSRSARYVRFNRQSERPFWVQIFGGEPEIMAQGAERAVELGAEIIDINMGCPVKKVTKNGAGSALLLAPKRARVIVEAIRLRTGKPVTVKIRAGWDAHTLNFIDMAKSLADGGCVAVAMHARTRAQGYSGTANWEYIRSLASQSPIPVIGNGDVFSKEQALLMLRETGCAGVMIGRGCLGNPWIFRLLTQDGAREPSGEERFLMVRRHLLEHIDFVGDELVGIRRFRQHLIWYSHGLFQAAAFRQKVNIVDSIALVLEMCEEFFVRARRLESSGMVEYDTSKALG